MLQRGHKNKIFLTVIFMLIASFGAYPNTGFARPSVELESVNVCTIDLNETANKCLEYCGKGYDWCMQLCKNICKGVIGVGKDICAAIAKCKDYKRGVCCAYNSQQASICAQIGNQTILPQDACARVNISGQSACLFLRPDDPRISSLVTAEDGSATSCVLKPQNQWPTTPNTTATMAIDSCSELLEIDLNSLPKDNSCEQNQAQIQYEQSSE